MKEETRKEMRRQIAHALGIVLVPLTFIFGKIFVGTASLVFALIIFILAEQKNYGTNRKKRKVSQYGMKTDSKQYADKSAQYQTISGTKKNALASVSETQVILNSIHSVFEKFERGSGNYRGAFYFYLASAASLFLFPQPVAMLSITVLALGDAFSTVVGIFGSHKIFYNRKKTWEGTLSGFIAAFAGCFFINPALALPAAFIGMLAESLPLKIDDNLTVPILTGIALSVISLL